jgi:predicted Zn-dependent protease
MQTRVIALIGAAVLAWPLAAGAAGGGGGGGGGAGGDEMAAPLRNADPEWKAGMAAVQRKDWPQVVERMGAYTKRNPEDAEGWNELGHAYRLTGQMETALEAYGKALKINPRHRGVHEYLGEAYLQMGDVARAEQELKVLDKLCFFGCEEYRDLKAGIAEYKKGRPAAAGS